MATKRLALKEKRAEPEPSALKRYFVTVGSDISEVLINPDGVVENADEPLEDWVGDAWAMLQADAKIHGWKIEAARAPEPVTKQPKIKPTVTDGVLKTWIDELTTNPPKVLPKAPPPPTPAGKAVEKIGDLIREGTLIPAPKRPFDVTALPSGLPAGGLVNDAATAWSSGADDLAKTAKEAERKAEAAAAEVKRLRNEFAVAMAKEGRGIDEMNKAIYGPAPQMPPGFEARLREIVSEELMRAVRAMGEYGGADRRMLREIEERIYHATKARAMEEEKRRRSHEAFTMAIRPGKWSDDPFGKW